MLGAQNLSDARDRENHYRDLAEKCRCLAASTLSSRMKQRYLLMAKDYVLLADVAGQRAHCARSMPERRSHYHD